MSDIYNLDFCIDEILQMNYYIIWKMWINQNVLYAITRPTQLSMHFFEYQKMHTLWRQVKLWLGRVLRDNITISDSKKIFGIAYKNYIIDTVI